MIAMHLAFAVFLLGLIGLALLYRRGEMLVLEMRIEALERDGGRVAEDPAPPPRALEDLPDRTDADWWRKG